METYFAFEGARNLALLLGGHCQSWYEFGRPQVGGLAPSSYGFNGFPSYGFNGLPSCPLQGQARE